MASIKDDKGFNQGFVLKPSTIVRMKRRAKYLSYTFKNLPNTAVLEIGCGTGEIAFWIAKENPNIKVLGTDICKPFIEEAKKKYQLPNLEYQVIDFNNPNDIQGRKFNYIIGNGILHHLYFNLDNALKSFKSLLLEKGEIIFMEPNILNPYCAIIFNIPYFRKKASLEPDEMAFSKNYIHKILNKNGFVQMDIQYKDFLLPGVPYIFVQPLIVIGNIVEKIPMLKLLSQSILIKAQFV